MKIILRNIKGFMRQHTGFFVLMVVTILVSVTIMLFSYGLFQNYKIIKTGFTYDDLTIDAKSNTESGAAPMTKGEIVMCLSALRSETYNDCELICAFSQIPDVITDPETGEKYPLELISRFLYEDGKFKAYAKLYDTLVKQGWFLSGSYYTDEQYRNGDPLMLMPEGMYGDDYELKLQGKTFKTAAVIKRGEPDFIFTALDDSTEVMNIAFDFKSKPSQNQYNDIYNVFTKMFRDRIVFPYDPPTFEDYWLYNTIMLAAVLIAIVASVNLMILYQYILMKRRKAMAVFMICGCRKKKTIMMYLVEAMLITIPCFIISALIYHYCLIGLLEKKYRYIASAYSAKLYIISFIIFMIISTLGMYLVSSSIVKKSSIIEIKAGD